MDHRVITYCRSEPWWGQILPQTVCSQFSLNVAEQCREILFLGNPIPLDRLFVRRELGRMIHGVSIRALKLNHSPACLRLFQGTKQLIRGVKNHTSLK